MGKLALVLMLLSFAIAMAPLVLSAIEESKGAEEWLSKLRYAKQKVTHLHFYFHDTLSGKNPSSLPVAKSSISDKSPTFFGLTNLFDDPLTVGPEPTSKLVGPAQGLYGFASFEDQSLLVAMNFVFTDGKYNGSTLTILGRDDILAPLREMPIVGGTGVFRFASGFAALKTYTFNRNTGDAIVEYNIVAIHY